MKSKICKPICKLGKNFLNTKLLYHILENFLSFEKIIKISILSYSQIHHFTWYISHIHLYTMYQSDKLKQAKCPSDRALYVMCLDVIHQFTWYVSIGYITIHMWCIRRIHHHTWFIRTLSEIFKTKTWCIKTLSNVFEIKTWFIGTIWDVCRFHQI